MMSAMDHMPLAIEAAKKSSVAWLSVGGAPAQAFWYLARGTELLVVTGGDEQTIAGLDSDEGVVTFRSKDNGSSIVAAGVRIETLAVDSEPWVEAVSALAPKRLNASADDLINVWRKQSRIHLLTLTTATRELGDSGGHEAVRQSPAGTGRPLPFHLGKRARRKQGA